MFQAALGGAVLFNPERAGRPAGRRGGARRPAHALLAARPVRRHAARPVGPPPGARVRQRRAGRARRRGRGGRRGAVSPDRPLYLGALAVAGVSRFVLAGLSVALPHVVERRHLVEANTLAVTAGAGVAALGGGERDRSAAARRLGERGLGDHHARGRRGPAARRRAGHRLRRAAASAPTGRAAPRARRRRCCAASSTGRARRLPTRPSRRRSPGWPRTGSRSASAPC